MKRLDAAALSKAERDEALRSGCVQVNGQTIRVEGTAQRLGGRRLWWSCPECDRRSRYLYPGGQGWACRECRDLTYPSRAMKGTSGALAYRALQALLLARRSSRPWRASRLRRASQAWSRAVECTGTAAVALLDVEQRTIQGALQRTAERYEATGSPGSFAGSWQAARRAVDREGPTVATGKIALALWAARRDALEPHLASPKRWL